MGAAIESLFCTAKSRRSDSPEARAASRDDALAAPTLTPGGVSLPKPYHGLVTAHAAHRAGVGKTERTNSSTRCQEHASAAGVQAPLHGGWRIVESRSAALPGLRPTTGSSQSGNVKNSRTISAVRLKSESHLRASACVTSASVGSASPVMSRAAFFKMFLCFRSSSSCRKVATAPKSASAWSAMGAAETRASTPPRFDRSDCTSLGSSGTSPSATLHNTLAKRGLRRSWGNNSKHWINCAVRRETIPFSTMR
mmetsp:Transcript_105245/g.322616  ORF Transcript_105245/g.322616 Transcript_105245/m.322616 type:complete len:253 (-) Transcript_105245:384-1142(-)